MELNFFLSQVIRLKGVFGKRHFPDERVQLIWEEVKQSSNMDFKIIIDDFLADAKFAPTRKDFREAISGMRVRQHGNKKRSQPLRAGPNPKCKVCRDEGEVWAIRISDNSENWVFKCFCDIGMSSGNAWPVFKNELLKTFKIYRNDEM